MASSTTLNSSQPPKICLNAVTVKSESMPAGAPTVRGYDFNNGLNYHQLLASYKNIGFQAYHFGLAVEEIQRMIDKKKEPLPERKEYLDEFSKPKTSCTIYLGYTSNMISCGVREVIRFLVQHKMVDCLVTTTGGIEEDLMKCGSHFYLGDFRLKGSELRSKGLNRTGNLIVPNDGYNTLGDWMVPILDEMLAEQKNDGINWTPSKMIARLGEKINHPDSVCYWAYKNNIPIFCPAITDGAIGDDIFFHSFTNPGLRIDIAEDIRRLHSISACAVNTGIIILGGGLIKHHICNSNLMRNGADYAVYVNTANEFDGSDAGASPDEAISWGKIKIGAKPVKIVGDASLIFPLLVAETFARDFHLQNLGNGQQENNDEQNGSA